MSEMKGASSRTVQMLFHCQLSSQRRGFRLRLHCRVLVEDHTYKMWSLIVILAQASPSGSYDTITAFSGLPEA
ncbi:hypothetical protein ACOSQ2_025003 [Xanthoceras sorbifolium]